MNLTSARLQVIKGDANQAASFSDALQNQDAVVSALGISSFRKSLQTMTFHRDTAHSITEQMKRNNVKRLVCVTSVGVMKNPNAPFIYKLIVKPLLEHKYEDMRQMEQVVRDSGLQWTVVRPFRLTGGKPKGTYRIATDGQLQNGGSIARADLADLLLKELDSKEHLHKYVAVSY